MMWKFLKQLSSSETGMQLFLYSILFPAYMRPIYQATCSAGSEIHSTGN